MVYPHTVAVLGPDNAEHRVVVTAISSPDGTSYQGHAQCTCGWLTVDILPSLSEAKGIAHVRAHRVTQ